MCRVVNERGIVWYIVLKAHSVLCAGAKYRSHLFICESVLSDVGHRDDLMFAISLNSYGIFCRHKRGVFFSFYSAFGCI